MHRKRPRLTFLPVLALAAAGCLPGSPPKQDGGGDDPSTGIAMPASTSTSGATSTSGTTQPTTSSESGDSTSSSTSDSSSSISFIHEPDQNLIESCNGYMQDCPAGQKCMPYADDGGGSWNNTKCVPVMENPAGVGEPCFVVDGGTSGIDNCELGAMCWDVDVEDKGLCITMCTGSPEAGICPQGFWCASFARGGAYAGVCIPECDPLAPDCDPSDVCIPNPNGVGFLCVLDTSGRAGQAHDPCLFANACDPGLWCVDVASAKECDPQGQGCCEPFCDITAPNTCPGQDQVCVTIYDGEPDPDHPNVGYCSLPI